MAPERGLAHACNVVPPARDPFRVYGRTMVRGTSTVVPAHTATDRT